MTDPTDLTPEQLAPLAEATDLLILAGALFAPTEKEEAPPADTGPGPNHVPGEGDNPAAGGDEDRELRRAVARLFDHPNQDQI